MNNCLNYDFKMISMNTMINNIQHRGAEFTELHRASLRPLRSPLRLCVKNSNAKTLRFFAKDAKKYQHEGTKTERHEESLVSKSLTSQISKSQIK